MGVHIGYVMNSISPSLAGRLAIFILPALLIPGSMSGCGGGGKGEGLVITRANRAQFSQDATILAARTATGPWIPADTTAAIDLDMAKIREHYPQVSEIHALPDYDLNTLIFGVKTSSPWINNWRSGVIGTGEAALDDLIHQYDPASIKDKLFESEGHAWFVLQFGGPLNMTRLSSLFQGKSPNVALAEANGYIVDGNQILLTKAGDNKVYTFSKGWGDCPAGCIHRHSWEFTLKPNATIVLREFGDPLDGSPGGV